MNAAAAALLLAATAANAVPQVGRQQVLASFESDKARARHHLIILNCISPCGCIRGIRAASQACLSLRPPTPWLPLAVGVQTAPAGRRSMTP